jgi:hypothetical protein
MGTRQPLPELPEAPGDLGRFRDPFRAEHRHEPGTRTANAHLQVMSDSTNGTSQMVAATMNPMAICMVRAVPT